MPSDSATRFKGKPKGSKRVAWCEPLKLPEVKAVSRALGCSINDVLLSCVAGAMRRYLADKGDRTEGVEIRALVPNDLRQPGDPELGNRFGILVVELPVGIEDPIERLMTVRQRMSALKASYEPATTLGLFAALGYVPKIVQDQLLDLLASRATAVITNVQGPSEPLTVAGSRLKQSLSWVPQTGDVGMGVAIYSYAGQVQFGLVTDAALTPDPEALVGYFPEEFDKYLYSILLDPPPSKAEAPGRLASPVQPGKPSSRRLRERAPHPPDGLRRRASRRTAASAAKRTMNWKVPRSRPRKAAASKRLTRAAILDHVRWERWIRFLLEVPGNGGICKGFRTPAPLRTVVRAPGPASESLPRRKPRDEGEVWRARPMGI